MQDVMARSEERRVGKECLCTRWPRDWSSDVCSSDLIFVIQHLLINHFAVYGEESFNKAASFMGDLPFVTILEIFVIYLPILFHAILGVYIVLVAKNNAGRYG